VKTLVCLQWINQPNISFALQADLAIAMILLTLALTPIIISSSFENEYKKKAFYALILLWFCHGRTFLASDYLYYIFWELSLIPIYFIASYVTVMLKNVKKQ
jgi:NADH-quinone oxidoreductase subunit M